jgi:hypothetical protein
MRGLDPRIHLSEKTLINGLPGLFGEDALRAFCPAMTS